MNLGCDKLKSWSFNLYDRKDQRLNLQLNTINNIIISG